MTKNVRVHISNLLSDKEWGNLRLFCDKARRLAATKFVSGQTKGIIKGKFRYGNDTGWQMESEIPSEEIIAEFLMAFRFFYLKKEPTQFPKILGIIGKYTNNEDFRKSAKLLGNKWKDCLFGKTFTISLNDKEVTSSILLDLWFNAHYFHQDQGKKKELDKLIDGFSENFAKYMLLDAAFEGAKLVSKLFEGIHIMVDKHFNSN